MQEKSRFMVSWVPYRNGDLFRDSSRRLTTSITNGFAGVWFRQEKPLRFRAGPAGAAPARPARDCLLLWLGGLVVKGHF